MNAEILDTLDAYNTIIDLTVGYSSRVQQAGFQRENAEMIAVDFHRHLLDKIQKSQDR